MFDILVITVLSWYVLGKKVIRSSTLFIESFDNAKALLGPIPLIYLMSVDKFMPILYKNII